MLHFQKTYKRVYLVADSRQKWQVLTHVQVQTPCAFAGIDTSTDMAHTLSSLRSIVAHKQLVFASLSYQLLFLFCFGSYRVT
jgi:hypothetical protein